MDEELAKIKRNRARLEKKFKGLSRILVGSLVVNRRICGNPNCKCARGEKHAVMELSGKVNGVTKNIYIPWKMADEARAMAKNYGDLWDLMKEISAVNLAILRFGVKSRRGSAKKT